jgi:hypothetical protein
MVQRPREDSPAQPQDHRVPHFSVEDGRGFKLQVLSRYGLKTAWATFSADRNDYLIFH